MATPDTVLLKRWEEFTPWLNRLWTETLSRKESSGHYFSELLFRGQADSAWKLETTLERAGKGKVGVADYNKIVTSARRFLGNVDHLSVSFEEDPRITQHNLSLGVPNYEYWAYLRHHGFPSPLLDWSASPYVAAYFAFRAAKREHGQNVAICVYQEHRGSAKSSFADEPCIRVCGPWAPIHTRHLLQQSWYTYCIQQRSDSEFEFCQHESAEVNIVGHGDYGQDALWKVEIPIRERKKALRDLYRMNVTPYSILHSEEALIDTAAMILFELDN